MFRKTNWFKEYFQRHVDKFNLETIKDQEMFIVDHQELVSEEILKSTWPQLKEDLIQNAVQTLSALSLAMHQVNIFLVTLFFQKMNMFLLL
jgi:DNA helicase MCM8